MFQRAEGRIRVSFGFCLLTAWFGLVNGWRPLGNFLGAAAVHELGHCLALRCLGTAWKSLRIGVFGAVLETNDSRLSYGGELICVLAGPAANLLCAAVCAAVGRGRWDAAAGANLVLCIFNLLPLRPLDGGRALHLAVSWLAGEVDLEPVEYTFIPEIIDADNMAEYMEGETYKLRYSIVDDEGNIIQ